MGIEPKELAGQSPELNDALRDLAQKAVGVVYTEDAPSIDNVPLGKVLVSDDGTTKSVSFRTGQEDIVTLDGVDRDVYTGVPRVTNAKFVRAFHGNMSGSTDYDLYTCPAGKQAAVLGLYFFEDIGGSITVTDKVKISGTYYPLGVATITGSDALPQAGIFLSAGQSYSISHDGGSAGPNAWARIFEFDAHPDVKIYFYTSLSSGDNTLYTVPAGKSAITINNAFIIQGSPSSDVPSLVYRNTSGGARTISLYNVPSGGSAGASNLVRASSSPASGSGQFFNILATMDAGDFIVLNTDAATATQYVWFTMFEL